MTNHLEERGILIAPRGECQTSTRSTARDSMLFIRVYPLNLRRKSALFRWGNPAFAFVAGDDAVTDMDDAVGVLGDIGFMGDKHDGVAFAMKVFHKLHDFVSGL